MKNYTKMVYDILYETLIAAKSLRFRFDKTDGFIRIYDGTRYLKLIVCLWKI